MADTCGICTPGLCAHGPASAEPLSLEGQLGVLRAELDLERLYHRNTKTELDQAKAELATAVEATKRGWEALSEFQREILKAYRRTKKITGHKPRPGRRLVVP